MMRFRRAAILLLVFVLLLACGCAPRGPAATPTPTAEVPPSPTAAPEEPSPSPATTDPPESPSPEDPESMDGADYGLIDEADPAAASLADFVTEAGERVDMESLLLLSGSDLVLCATEEGRELIVTRRSDYTRNWWALAGEKDPEFGWIAGPEGAGIDMETAEALSESLMENQWVIPENGYSLLAETISFLGQNLCYVEAAHHSGYQGNMQLLVACTLPDRLQNGANIGWFPLACRTTGWWHRVEG